MTKKEWQHDNKKFGHQNSNPIPIDDCCTSAKIDSAINEDSYLPFITAISHQIYVNE